MQKLLTLLLLLTTITFTSHGQKRLINSNWEFQRLTNNSQRGEIKNQGSDWSSQYNVVHVSHSVMGLEVSKDTLQREFAALESGTWSPISLPHTPFIEELTIVHQWQGICYYRKQLKVTAEESKDQLWIEFEGAMQLADVWVNGTHLMQHAGGYTPFVVDVTGLLKADQENEVLVRLDNRDNPLIPPGKPLNTLDFCYYGGIYRDVHLIAKPSVYITHPILANKQAGGGIFVTYPNVSDERAEIRIQTQVQNAQRRGAEITLRQSLYEWSRKGGKGKLVMRDSQPISIATALSKTAVQTLVLENPKLWHPEHPNLYILTSEVLVNGKVVDCEETRMGIRHLEMTHEKGFVINGKPLRLVGSNRHMDYPYVGNAISDHAQYRDMYQIRNSGFNIVRLGHYPQDPSVLDACDELGLLAIEPIPGWQFFNKDPLFTALTFRDVRDMIRRDRNHPSVVIWETTLNEAWPPADWKNEAIKVAHEEYPGNQCFTAGDTYGYDGFDVSYNDWEQGFKRPNKTTNPGFIREYYDYEFGGHYSTTRIRRGDGERAEIQNLWNAQWSHNRYRALYPHTMGDAVWSMYDYNRGCCDNICYSGLADLFRLPKFGLHFFRTQLPAGSYLPEGKMAHELFVATYRGGILSDTLLVYGNVERVEIELNGKPIAQKRADNGADSDYVTQPNGGNVKQLAYPPFTFTAIPQEEGTLKAIGYVGEKRVASYCVRTPEPLHHLTIDYFESGRPAATNDLLIVHVSLQDVNKTLCLENDIEVTLTAEGGKIVGPSTYATENGIASFLVQTDDHRKLVLKATCGRLSQKRSIELVKE